MWVKRHKIIETVKQRRQGTMIDKTIKIEDLLEKDPLLDTISAFVCNSNEKEPKKATEKEIRGGWKKYLSYLQEPPWKDGGHQGCEEGMCIRCLTNRYVETAKTIIDKITFDFQNVQIKKAIGDQNGDEEGYFSFDEEEGFIFHDTAKEAQREAMKALFFEAEAAEFDRWGEDVEKICWGKIFQRSKMTDCYEASPEHHADIIADYELRPPLPGDVCPNDITVHCFALSYLQQWREKAKVAISLAEDIEMMSESSDLKKFQLIPEEKLKKLSEALSDLFLLEHEIEREVKKSLSPSWRKNNQDNNPSKLNKCTPKPPWRNG